MEVREPEDDYDEFDALGEAAAELGLAPDEVPPVSRRSVQVTPTQQVSVLVWDDVASLRCPVMLVRGGLSAFVTAEDEQKFVRRLPPVRTETVPGAGHSVQSDQPWGLARLIDDFDSSR